MAHVLTSVRLLLAGPVALALARPGLTDAWALFVLLTMAALTDYVDGKVARSRGTASPGGQLFDHGTDCLFVTAGLSGAAAVGMVPWALPILIPIAFTQYVLDSFCIYRQKRLRMSSIGRWNGVLYFVPPFFVAGSRLVLPSGLPSVLATAALFGSYLLVASTILSIIDRATATQQPHA